METKLDKKMEMVNVAVSPIAPNADVEKHNPIGKIPALSVRAWTFSTPVICEYLDNQHKGRRLLPRKGRDRWVALRQQAMADGLLDAAIPTRVEHVPPDASFVVKRSPPVIYLEREKNATLKKVSAICDAMPSGSSRDD